MDDWQYQTAKDLNLPPAQRWKSLRRESGLGESAARLLWRGAIRSYLSVWHRLSVSGREHLPAEPPFVMIANHTSHLDALVLAAALPARLRDRVLPLAAGDTFFETPALAAFAAGLMNALPMWRRNCGRHAMEELRQRLIEEPCAYILFPEGTRARDGQLARFKAGLGMLVAGTGAAVVPCHLAGAHAALPAGRRVPRPAKLRLRIGPPLRFEDVPSTREGWEQVAQATQQAVIRLSST